jgi:Ca2+-binding EF-hand superfamily protein
LNNDGHISKAEMSRFVKGYMTPPTEDEIFENMITEIFYQYDTDGSGYLDKKEVLKLLNDVLASKR